MCIYIHMCIYIYIYICNLYIYIYTYTHIPHRKAWKITFLPIFHPIPHWKITMTGGRRGILSVLELSCQSWRWMEWVCNLPVLRWWLPGCMGKHGHHGPQAGHATRIGWWDAAPVACVIFQGLEVEHIHLRFAEAKLHANYIPCRFPISGWLSSIWAKKSSQRETNFWP